MTNRERSGTTRWPWLVLALLALIVASGCEGTPAPETADEGRAREVLDQALTAWTRGQTVESLKQARPAITVSEPRWSEGASLVKFEVQGDGKPSAAERLFSVKLTLKDDTGNEMTETVDYKVGTSPVLTVFRSIF